MESSDKSLVEAAVDANHSPRLTKLYDEHKKLNKRVSNYENRPFLTSEEEVELKRLKVKKLQGMDEMMQIARAACV